MRQNSRAPTGQVHIRAKNFAPPLPGGYLIFFDTGGLSDFPLKIFGFIGKKIDTGGLSDFPLKIWEFI